MKRVILTLDLDAFFSSVAILLDPTLKGKNVAVGKEIGNKGIIATANYSAREYGLYSGMPMYKARLACPDLIVVDLKVEKYVELSEKVFTIVDKLVDKIEISSIDEAFADITSKVRTKEDALNYAKMIQDKVYRDVGLGISIGISNNKILSKMASNFEKPMGVSTLYKDELESKL
jgi:DNA polymerase-4